MNVSTTSDNIPLGIKHLFLFTTFAAVFFAFEKASDYWSQAASAGQSQAMLVARQTNGLLYHMMSAAAATGVITLLMHRDASGRAFRASGHWVILAHTITAIVWLPGSILFRGANTTWSRIAIVYSTISIVTAVAYILIALLNRSHWRWLFGARAVFTVLGVLLFLFSAGSVLSSLNQIATLVVALTMVGFLVYETIAGKHRDWPHFLGIASLVFTVVATGFWQVARYAGWFA